MNVFKKMCKKYGIKRSKNWEFRKKGTKCIYNECVLQACNCYTVQLSANKSEADAWSDAVTYIRTSPLSLKILKICMEMLNTEN